MNRGRKALFLGLALAAPVVLFLCLLLGASGVGLPDWNSETGRAVLLLRLGRVLAGFLVGASLATAGVVFQAILRNPLAEPYILGVSSGGGLGAAVAILSGLTALSPFALPLTAFVFALVTLAIVYALACRGGAPSVYGLILSGVIVSAVFANILMFMVSIAPVEGLHSVIWWMLGDLEIASRSLLLGSAALALGGFLAVWALSPELNALTLGGEVAHHVGVRTRVAVAAGLTLATLLTAVAVGLAGLIGFVGLIIPHVTRSVFGPDHRRLLPAAALAGGLFLAVCDAAARTLFAPMEIPVGVVTAMLGGPFFLAILRARKKQGWVE